MKVNKTPLDGFLVIEPDVYKDDRGFFLETYQEERYQQVGIVDKFVQDNLSHSKKGVLRGMHFQIKHPQAQIVTVMHGRIFDVCVDLRKESKTFGQWYGLELSDIGLRQIYMAPGFAHGFYVLSDWVNLNYKVSHFYNPSDEGGLLWCDEDVGIQWPTDNPKISLRDSVYPTLEKLIKKQQ
jgi:dTDP-4-dehydrorhamnose 3,5-epimerase